MKTRQFLNFTLPCVGQGVGGDDVYDDNHRIKVLQYGIDLGLTLIDTAEVYGDGRSEEVVGKATKGIRSKVFIATKFSPEHSHYADVKLSLEMSLKRLNTDYVDLYQIHWPNPSIPIAETMKALLELKSSGKIRHIGVSNFGMADLLAAQQSSRFQVASNQVEYNLLERGAREEILPYALERNIAILAYSPLRRGPKGEEFLLRMAAKYHKTSTQIVLNWSISQNNVIPIPKTLNLEHVRDNALSGEFSLKAEDILELESVFKPQLLDVPVRSIRVLGSKNEKIYTTLNEAVENRFRLEPDILSLADDIKKNKILKPVQLVPITSSKGSAVRYDLVQGRMRYWAWVYVYGQDSLIQAYIKE